MEFLRICELQIFVQLTVHSSTSDSEIIIIKITDKSSSQGHHMEDIWVLSSILAYNIFTNYEDNWIQF